MRRLLSYGVVLAATAFALTGCAGQTTESAGADITSGKEIFAQSCGACHVMQAANTQGTIGPNLDHAFGYPRLQEFDDSTFFEVTLRQMEIPVPPMPRYDEEGTEEFLPEEDRIAVAAFVAQCSAVAPEDIDPACGAGGEQDTTDPEAIFNQNCGSCHTLAAAGTTGTIGPNLDEAGVALRTAIMTIGNGSGAMPAFADTLTAEQINAVARYVVENGGGG